MLLILHSFLKPFICKNIFFNSFAFLFPSILVNELSRVVGGLGCVGKKTTLLQAEASACVSGLANVLFCALAFFIFQFCLYVANCPLCRFFTLGGNARGYGHLAVCGSVRCRTATK